MDNGEFLIYLTWNLLWTGLFCMSLLGGFMGAFLTLVGDIGEAIAGLILYLFFIAFGVAGLTLMVERVWPTWL
jgi:hypothetical protein